MLINPALHPGITRVMNDYLEAAKRNAPKNIDAYIQGCAAIHATAVLSAALDRHTDAIYHLGEVIRDRPACDCDPDSFPF